MAMVTMKEICKELDMHPDTVRKYVALGKIPASRPRRGRGWYRFDLGAVRLAMLEMMRNAGPARGEDGEMTLDGRIKAIEAAGAAAFWESEEGRALQAEIDAGRENEKPNGHKGPRSHA